MLEAAIGIGSNSLRMVIANVEGLRIERKGRYREGLRVFAALDKQGNISETMIAEACQKVRYLKEEAEKQGAQKIYLFATSATRDAKNQKAFVEALYIACGLRVHICEGCLEAKLSFLGATDGEYAGLIDIGGGSTEFAIGAGSELSFGKSLQMGAVRMCRAHEIQSMQDVPIVVKLCEDLLVKEGVCTQKGKTQKWVGVGGTFTTAAAFVQKIPLSQRALIHGFELTCLDVCKAIETLAPMPIQERLTLAYLQPQRADIVVHGLVILSCCMKCLEIDTITVSDCGNLEGYLKWSQEA